MTACPCGTTLDPKGDPLDWCGPGCQYRWMEQGTVPLTAPAPAWPTVPAPRPAPAPVAAPPTLTPVELEVPIDAPTRVARRNPFNRLRMGRGR